MKQFNTTIGKLYDIEQAILAKDIMNMSFSRKGGFSVARNMKKFTAELEDYKKQRSDLIKQYSDGADTIGPDNEKWDDFLKEYNDLNSVDVSIDINTIGEEDLPETATPFMCTLLDFMIEDTVESKEE